MKNISIAVLTYNGYDLTHQLLMDIKRNCANVHQVIVVDNASEDPAIRTGLDYWISLEVLPIEVHTLGKNRGFVGGMNYAKSVFSSSSDVGILLSNDVRVVSSNFLPEVGRVFSENENRLAGPTLYTQNTGWNMFGDVTVPYVEGYCLCASKKFWDTHEFDPIYSPSDFEDVDLSTQAVRDGYELYQLRSGMVQHLGGRTFGYNEVRVARTKKNKKQFADKWSLHE